MTHLIDQWRSSENVYAIQTTQSLKSEQNFSVHPKHADQALIELMIQSFNLPHDPMFLLQVHGNQVIEYRQQPQIQLQHQADACFTREPNVICAIMTADCLPVLLTDAHGSFIAAVHCGWRSLYSNILQTTLQAIQSKHSVRAWFGPCIQQQQYEVGEDFVEHYLTKHPAANPAFSSIHAGKSQADLYAMASIQLNQLGVHDIEYDGQCTVLNPSLHSWRQNQSVMRMATMAWLNKKSP